MRGISPDARNSLIAWGAVLALAVYFWLSLKYHLVPQIPDEVRQTIDGIILLGLIARLLIWLVCRVRATWHTPVDG